MLNKQTSIPTLRKTYATLTLVTNMPVLALGSHVATVMACVMGTPKEVSLACEPSLRRKVDPFPSDFLLALVVLGFVGRDYF